MVETNNSVALVCDASAGMGTGHVSRQLTLGAELAEQGIDSFLFSFDLPDVLRDRASHFGIRVLSRRSPQESDALSVEIVEQGPRCVIFDGYVFNERTISDVYSTGIPVVVLDDMGEHNFAPSHLRINQNLYADMSMYRESATTGTYLLGPEYSLINRDIIAFRNKEVKRDDQKVFITVGGSDSRGLAASIHEICKNRFSWRIESTGNALKGGGLTPSQMGLALRESGVGVTACGTTVLEAMCLGMPFVGIVVADNQEKVGAALVNNFKYPVIDFRDIEQFEDVVQNIVRLMNNEELRIQLSNAGQKAVDGLGASRISAEISRLFFS